MSQSKDQFMQLRSEETELHSGITFEHLISAKKTNLATAVDTIVQSIKDGNVDSLDALILAVKGKAFFEQLGNDVRPLTNNDYLDKLDKGYAKHDTAIEQGATKTEYDYSVCKDPVFDDLLTKANGAKELLDERKAFLKAIKKPLEIVDTDTGETYTIYPPNKLQSEGLKLTIR